eukprot:1080138_1
MSSNTDELHRTKDVDNAVVIFTFSLLLFTCLLGTTIAIYALWRIFYKNADELKNVDKITVYTAASCIILHALTGIWDPLGYFFFFMTSYENIANLIWLMWDILWTLSKLNLYFVYIYRCYITFKDTKYAHSPYKIYVPLALAWILQLLNGMVFVLHKLNQTDLVQTDPLTKDAAVIVASSYLVLDLFIVLSVVFLFLNPVTRLMADLRTKSERLMHVNTPTTEIQLVVGNESSSSEPLTPTTPHSPTKMGAAYYYKSNRKGKKGAIAIPTNTSIPAQHTAHSNTAHSNTATLTDTNTTSVFKMPKNMERLPCPEDEAQEDEMVQLHPLKVSKQFKGIIWNAQQMQILNTGTRLALLSLISLCSGFVYQTLWIISVRIDDVGHFTYTWGIDTVINIVCIYLSFHFAVVEYDILCSKCCHCHGCCLRYVDHMARKRVG